MIVAAIYTDAYCSANGTYAALNNCASIGDSPILSLSIDNCDVPFYESGIASTSSISESATVVLVSGAPPTSTDSETTSSSDSETSTSTDSQTPTSTDYQTTTSTDSQTPTSTDYETTTSTDYQTTTALDSQTTILTDSQIASSAYSSQAVSTLQTSSTSGALILPPSSSTESQFASSTFPTQTLAVAQAPSTTFATTSSSSSFPTALGGLVSHGLSTGAKAGIGVGVTFGVICFLAGAAMFWLSRRRTRAQQAETGSQETETGTSTGTDFYPGFEDTKSGGLKDDTSAGAKDDPTAGLKDDKSDFRDDKTTLAPRELSGIPPVYELDSSQRERPELSAPHGESELPVESPSDDAHQ